MNTFNNNENNNNDERVFWRQACDRLDALEDANPNHWDNMDDADEYVSVPVEEEENENYDGPEECYNEETMPGIYIVCDDECYCFRCCNPTPLTSQPPRIRSELENLLLEEMTADLSPTPLTRQNQRTWSSLEELIADFNCLEDPNAIFRNMVADEVAVAEEVAVVADEEADEESEDQALFARKRTPPVSPFDQNKSQKTIHEHEPIPMEICEANDDCILRQQSFSYELQPRRLFPQFDDDAEEDEDENENNGDDTFICLHGIVMRRSDPTVCDDCYDELQDQNEGEEEVQESDFYENQRTTRYEGILQSQRQNTYCTVDEINVCDGPFFDRLERPFLCQRQTTICAIDENGFSIFNGHPEGKRVFKEELEEGEIDEDEERQKEIEGQDEDKELEDKEETLSEMWDRVEAENAYYDSCDVEEESYNYDMYTLEITYANGANVGKHDAKAYSQLLNRMSEYEARRR